jgi:hypothetical protein
MGDLNWISQEAHRIHDWFHAIFYVLVTVFLLVGVLIEYFKLPLGGTPTFGPLVGRALIAAILLFTYPEIANTVNDISSALSQKLGDLADFKIVLDKMGQKIDQLSWSWTSVRESLIVALTYLSFFLLYFSVHVAQAIYLYSSVILYIFSPILIALFVLPQTAAATSALFRSLFELSMWKPVWCVIATLIWSTGVSEIQGSGSNVSFLSAVCFCLIAAGSLLCTPMVVHALASAGLTSMAQNISTIGVPGVGSVTPLKALTTASDMVKRTTNAGFTGADLATRQFPRTNQIVQQVPRFSVPPRKPIFVRRDGEHTSNGENNSWAGVSKTSPKGKKS